jgi:hypothetical protein
MRHRIFAAAVAIVTLLPTKPIADVSLSIIEYRVLTQLGQVRMTAGFVHNPEMQKAMLADLGSFERQGIILIGGDSDRQFNRRETIGSHSVETTISVSPAVGLGYRGASQRLTSLLRSMARRRSIVRMTEVTRSWPTSQSCLLTE